MLRKYILLSVFIFIISLTFIYFLADNQLNSSMIGASIIVSLSVPFMIWIAEKETKNFLPLNIPRKYWNPYQEATVPYRGTFEKLVKKIKKFVQNKKYWEFFSVDYSEKTIKLKTKSFYMGYGSITMLFVKKEWIQEKEINIYFDQENKLVHITSKPPDKNFLYKELKDYGKSYHNIQELKKVISSDDM